MVRRGFTLLEVVISVFILSILSSAVIHGLSTLEIESRIAKDRMSSALLAADLREEILSKPALDPDGAPRFGREAGESGGARLAFDDQDDYHGLVDRPSSDLAGNPLDGMEHIWRTVYIERVDPDLPEGSAADTRPVGLRRFRVTVYRDQAEIAHLVWLGLGQER